MCFELIDAFDRIDADDSVRAVIVTGSGRAVCAGADSAAAVTRSIRRSRGKATRSTSTATGAASVTPQDLRIEEASLPR